MDTKVRRRSDSFRYQSDIEREKCNLDRAPAHLDGNRSKETNNQTQEAVSVESLEEIAGQIFSLSDELLKCLNDPDYAFEQGNKRMAKLNE